MCWRDIPNYDGYQASSDGRVRSVKRNDKYNRTYQSRELSAFESNSGYLYVDLSLGGSTERVAVHDAVLLAFEGPKPEGYEVNHLDGDKQNNELGNLEYCTRSENVKHAINELGKFQHERVVPKGEDSGNSKVTEDDVRKIRQLDDATDLTHREIANRFGISRSAVSMICRRETWGHVE